MRYQDIEHFKNTCGYTVNGLWYPRVTKILDIKSKPALEGFLREVESYSSAEDIKNKSAKEGSLVHEVVEKVATGQKVDIPESILPAIRAFTKFKDSRGIIFCPEFIEKQIWSPKYRYAGTVDALAFVDGKFGVLDIKTSSGFWPEYNLQTAAYVSALQELEVKKAIGLPKDVQTRWILRIDQRKNCRKCGATLREKGGRIKIRPVRRSFNEGGNGKAGGVTFCGEDSHEWGELKGEVELREFPYPLKDLRAFMAAKILWEWENEYWLKQTGYL